MSLQSAVRNLYAISCIASLTSGHLQLNASSMSSAMQTAVGEVAAVGKEQSQT